MFYFLIKMPKCLNGEETEKCTLTIPYNMELLVCIVYEHWPETREFITQTI